MYPYLEKKNPLQMLLVKMRLYWSRVISFPIITNVLKIKETVKQRQRITYENIGTKSLRDESLTEGRQQYDDESGEWSYTTVKPRMS